MTTAHTRPATKRQPLDRIIDGVTKLLLTPHPSSTYSRSLGLSGHVSKGEAVVASATRPSDDWLVLTLRPSQGYRRPPAGGAVSIGVVIDGVVHTRFYSPIDPVAASPRTPGAQTPDVDPSGAIGGTNAGRPLTLVIRRHADGFVSDHLWRTADEGQMLLLDEESQGDPEAALPERRPHSVLLVSGGSGLTPMLAIASTLAAENHTGRVAWLHYTKSTSDIPVPGKLREIAANSGIDLRIVTTGTDAPGSPAGDVPPTSYVKKLDTPASTVGAADPDHHGLRGHILKRHVDAVAPWLDEAEVFCCGPDSLADGLSEILGPERSEWVRRERFKATLADIPDTDGGTVTFARSGRDAEVTGTTILEGAEGAGLSPTFGCRMGICFQCAATRLSGATRDIRTGEVDNTPDKQVQVCISAPVGDVEMDL